MRNREGKCGQGEQNKTKTKTEKKKKKPPPTKTVKKKCKQPRKLLNICQSKQSVWVCHGSALQVEDRQHGEQMEGGKRKTNGRGKRKQSGGAAEPEQDAGWPDCEPQDTPSAMQNRTYLSGLLVLSAETKQSYSQQEAKSK